MLPGQSSGNRLIDALSASERAQLLRAGELVELAAGRITQQPNETARFVYFPIDAVFSVVASLQDGRTCEVGQVGNEGVSGVEGAFGAEVLRTTLCQVAGTAIKLPTSHFLDLILRHGSFDLLIRSTEKARGFVCEQMIICNIMHSIDERLARWLLMLMDRASDKEFAITHEYLSFMLGVRRAGVSNAATKLSRAGIIAYRRGYVRVIDRAQLEKRACECYPLMAEAFDHSLRPASRPVSGPGVQKTRRR